MGKQAKVSGKSPQVAGTSAAGALVDRRRIVRLWWQTPKEKRPSAPKGTAGLALSGGGIRSATFSLGAIQALSKSERDALGQVDILSTVSGGGYIGCFLRSLFMPDQCRGIVPAIGKVALGQSTVTLDEAAVADQYEFAREVLSSTPDRKDIGWPRNGKPVERRNPLWWLREHSRYLAPNGPTDYGYAAAYIARNWLSMIFIFLVANVTLFSLLVAVEGAVASMSPALFHWTWVTLGSATTAKCLDCAKSVATIAISPAIVFTAVPLVISIIAGIAYWMTQAMSPNEFETGRQEKNLVLAVSVCAAAAALIVFARKWIVYEFQEPAPAGNPIPPGSTLMLLLSIGILLTIFGALLALVSSLAIAHRPGSLTATLRRMFTTLLAWSNKWFAILLVVGLIDSIGARLADPIAGLGRGPASIGAIFLPALAFLTKKLPDWFGGPSKNSLFSLFQRSMSTVALVAGLALFGLVAVAADAMVHANAWTARAWISAPDWPPFLLFLFIAIVLSFVCGWSTGFINLSSLHSFYASRLTRAYLGASNNERLKAAAEKGPGSNIKETDPKDFIQARLYCSADLPAPIHIINATINETIDPHSQLVARDRKGDSFSLEPGGINVGEEFLPWSKVGRDRSAEQLSLGQWCSISGAAASSGMGRLTSLGFALAFTFANVRLGYWWWSPKVCENSKLHLSLPMAFFARRFGTFVYLANEMTARYSRGYRRKYLTDGGHFENSGAYRLIGHKVPLILVCDNGADEHYRFEDLENLVRTVRLDFGADFKILGGTTLKNWLGELGASNPSVFVDPEKTADWRAQFLDPKAASFALVLRATLDAETVHLVWIKPRMLADLPADLLGYSEANPTFPQQSTGDQFFDEAQWESYRKLGEILMGRLLDDCPGLLAAVPKDAVA